MIVPVVGPQTSPIRCAALRSRASARMPMHDSVRRGLPTIPHQVGHLYCTIGLTLFLEKAYSEQTAASQAERRRFESDRPLKTSRGDSVCPLASSFANSQRAKALQRGSSPHADLPPRDTPDISGQTWPAIRYQVGHLRAPRAPSWSPEDRPGNKRDRFLASPGKVVTDLYNKDQFHLSAKSYHVWADAMSGPFEKMLKQQRRKKLWPPRRARVES